MAQPETKQHQNRIAGEAHLKESFFRAAPDRFLDLALDNFFVSLCHFLGHTLQISFKMVCRDFILPAFCKSCLFLSSIQLAHFIRYLSGGLMLP